TGGTADRNRSHWSTSKTPSYTKSVSWQHHRVNADPESTRILDCVLDLARKLSISIVAEGVETKEQLDYLNQNNITFQQGYYFYKPVTYIDLVKIILSKPKVKVVVE
ncbi:EAL domain-containing protein, partial [Escherichia coli]|uniref:EAL domain-containing protein n=1 Tax=Escherichia coli TaxID=562 RepID=UPI00321864DF